MDTRDKPIEPVCHTDPISFVAAATDGVDEVEHVTPYEEDALFKDALGPVHQAALKRNSGFWVQK